ncbi:pentapeptide repeat-containing protein [Streptomyces sp. NPDC051636]|uniref:pentapeptide repeat-containing protein n=1 Tax=Streptomyces sp. NPDC051636 TaxID=3365663 RepID=UPI0037AD8041
MPSFEGRGRTQWVGLIAISLPGLAALGALLFTWMQVGQASKELRISEHGQITSRFNAAVGNLGSQSLDIRLGGIYALQRIMQDSARDHPTVVSVLAAFAQRHAGSSAESLKEPQVIPTLEPDVRSSAPQEIPTPEADVRAAIATLAHRRPDRDRGTVIDLSKTDLRGLRFTEREPIKLPGVDLTDADLRAAFLIGADLHKATLHKANLESADLDRANLRGADMSGASLPWTNLVGADLRRADMGCGEESFDADTGDELGRYNCVNLQYASLEGADLRNAKMSDADLRNAFLSGADLRGADLARSNLSNADLTNADFRGAKLTNVKLKGAKRTGARGLPQEG